MATANGRGKANGKQRPATKAAKTVAKAKSRAPRGEGEGADTIIRREVIKNPLITSKEMQDVLARKSRKVSPSTVSAILAHTRATMRMLDKAGHLKGLK